MTASELKQHVEQTDNGDFFFTRNAMKFFGDTMRNYGVCSSVVSTHTQSDISVWELYRKNPVKYGLQNSAYFNKTTFNRVFAKR